jgi:MSHA biogenesis protein MshI
VSGQINLYEARLHARNELLTGSRAAIVVGLALASIIALGVVSRTAAERSAAELGRLQAELSVAQQTHAALSKTLAERKVSRELLGEIERAKAQLASRSAVMALLDSGQVGNSSGFSGVMSGFSRQTSSDLWLTAFSVGLGGKEIEIRGRLLDSSKLPSYVVRLGSEPAFKGVRLATLEMHDVDPRTAKPEAGAAAPAKPGAAQPALPRYVEFVLRSEMSADAAAPAGGKK